jgi:uncharacterized integral membrane protein
MENQQPQQKKSNSIKLIVITVLFTLFIIVSLQNLGKVELDVLIWKWDVPLVLLLTINSIVIAIITFILTKWRKR